MEDNEAVKTNHIKLYNQNIEAGTISTTLLDKYKLPAIVIEVEILRESDCKQLKNTLNLAVGNYFLYIKYGKELLNAGRCEKTLGSFLAMTSAFNKSKIYEVIINPENDNKVEKTEITQDDMLCTMTLCTQHVIENPELHIDYIKDHLEKFADVVENNEELFK